MQYLYVWDSINLEKQTRVHAGVGSGKLVVVNVATIAVKARVDRCLNYILGIVTCDD
jgi:hypothetical protein